MSGSLVETRETAGWSRPVDPRIMEGHGSDHAARVWHGELGHALADFQRYLQDHGLDHAGPAEYRIEVRLPVRPSGQPSADHGDGSGADVDTP